MNEILFYRTPHQKCSALAIFGGFAGFGVLGDVDDIATFVPHNSTKCSTIALFWGLAPPHESMILMCYRGLDYCTIMPIWKEKDLLFYLKKVSLFCLKHVLMFAIFKWPMSKKIGFRRSK